MSSPSLDSRYLPHINGLRALAILGVLIYHLRASYCPAGYFGVDLFLVISGFLLFRSLLKPGAEQGFHYGSYLLKKAWRIIPSWFVVSIVVCACAAYLMPASRMADLLKTARYSAFFQADYYIDRSGDYFNVFSQQNPLLHYWYLSITEQIYIIAPLLIIPLMRWCSRRAAIVLLSILSLLSFAYYVLTTSSLLPLTVQESLLHALGTKTSYYHLVPRFWEFAAGFAAFLLPELAGRPRLRALLGSLGFAGLLASFYLYETGSPSVYLAVACALITLRYGATGPVAHLLNSKPVQALGTISFSLYLWHWPIMVFWKYLCFDSPGVWTELLMVAVCLVVGALAWRFIESVKTPGKPGWLGTLQRCGVVLLIVIVPVVATQIHKHLKKQTALALLSMPTVPRAVPETDTAVLKGLEFMPAAGMTEPPMRMGSPEVAPSFFLIGDSHALQLSGVLHRECEKAGIRGLFLNNSVLPYWNLIQNRTAHDPATWNKEVATAMLDFLRQHPEIRYVLIAQRWEFRLCSLAGADWRTGESFDNEWGRTAITIPGLGEFCDQVRALGKEVVLLGDNPSFPAPFPLDEWQRYQKCELLQLIRPYRERVLTPAEHEAEQKTSYKLHRQLAQEGRARYIDLSVPMMVDGVYPARVNGVFLYSDDNHLTEPGVQRVVDYLLPRLQELLAEPAASNSGTAP